MIFTCSHFCTRVAPRKYVICGVVFAHMSRSGTSRATQNGWSSLGASGATSWVAKMQALNNLSVTVLVERKNSQHLPEAHHVDPNASTANQVSALLHDGYRFLGTQLRTGIREGEPLFLDQEATYCWSSSICVAWDSEKVTRSSVKTTTCLVVL